jgi:large subunit ribosomal protein L3
MMKGLIGRKIGMTQVLDADGVATPVTIVQAGPCYVTQVKTDATDGYTAVQVGFEETKEKRLSKGNRGHLGLLQSDNKHPNRKENNGIPAVRHLQEFRTASASEYSLGQTLTVEQFELGDKIDVTGTTKGRGFAGVVKRHGFKGGPKTHGQSDRWRAPGSIGATSTMARVQKGMRMAGHMGVDRHTVHNLTVVRIDAERNLLAIKGAVPGHKGGLVLIREAQKAG